MLKCDDGSGRDPRPEQIELFNHVIQTLSTVDVVGLNLPPGWGKSYLARAWQRQFGRTDIMTASNHLVDQYARTYPELNVVKGKAHYDTEENYNRAKSLARASKDSIFNPLSALFTRIGSLTPLRCVIVDEAHTLGDMLRSSATTAFNTSKSNIPANCNSEYDLSVWARQRFHALEDLISRGKASSAVFVEFERVGAIYYSIVGHELHSVFKVKRETRIVRGRATQNLIVDAVECPQYLLAQVLRADRVILMSGTLTQDETAMLAHGRKFAWISRPYLAPPEQRPVYIDALAREDRSNIPMLANKVRKIYEANGRCPTLVHVSYGDAPEYIKELRDLRPITNTKTTKLLAENTLRTQGGLWIAAGCAEGIDLADDACRVVIIPSLLFPNKGDLHVQKHLGLPGGQRWYCLKTLENTIQRLGRGLRHSKDHCKSYILDPAFPTLWQKYKDQFERLNIIWGS
jgi:Rad3-related DNA helicase